MLLTFSALPVAFFGQNRGAESGSGRYYEKWGVRGFAGQIVAHAADIENTAGAVPAAVELEYARRRIDSFARELCRCYPTTGVTLAYKDYNNSILGRGAHVAYFVQHHFFPLKKMNPYVRGTVGAGYASNPYDPLTNPDNQSYSFYINGYLQIAGGVEFPVSEKVLASAFLSFNHISNGGLAQPNRGINWPAAGVELMYAPDYKLPDKGFTKMNNRESKKSRRIHEVYVFGSAASHDYGGKRRLPVYGAGYRFGYSLTSLHRLTAGSEWHLDEGHEYRIESLPELSGNAHRAAVLGGHEFTMGHFVFSQELGVYVYDRARYHDPVYHRWGVRFVHSSGISIGGNLKAHRHVAEFIDFRAGFVF